MYLPSITTSQLEGKSFSEGVLAQLQTLWLNCHIYPLSIILLVVLTDYHHNISCILYLCPLEIFMHPITLKSHVISLIAVTR